MFTRSSTVSFMATRAYRIISNTILILQLIWRAQAASITLWKSCNQKNTDCFFTTTALRNNIVLISCGWKIQRYGLYRSISLLISATEDLLLVLAALCPAVAGAMGSG